VFLDRHVPAVRKHGYLLATVGVKPAIRSAVTVSVDRADASDA